MGSKNRIESSENDEQRNENKFTYFQALIACSAVMVVFPVALKYAVDSFLDDPTKNEEQQNWDTMLSYIGAVVGVQLGLIFIMCYLAPTHIVEEYKLLNEAAEAQENERSYHELAAFAERD